LFDHRENIMKKIAVILAGSGYLDGSEIREAVGVLWASSRAGAKAQCFAPEIWQRDVVDHLTGEPVHEKREVLVESARIARGNIRPLTELNANDFDALVLPGGYGAAKNLCSFGLEGSAGTVLHDVAKSLHDFHKQGKPIGAACIAPAILALAFRGDGLSLTVGAAGGESAEIEKLGHKHVVTKANEMHIDRKHRIVTTPAYMYGDAELADVFDGIRQMVDEVLVLATSAVLQESFVTA
jgi:enhancing lycopene biosynthesis protein 2